MRIMKDVLASKIAKLKPIVPRTSTMQVLQGILVSNGMMTATNMDLTIKTILDGADKQEKMIIPAAAFDLIANLPSGMMEITGDIDCIRIRMDSIVNEFSTISPDTFPLSDNDEGEEAVTIDAEELRRHLEHVLWAVSKKDGNMAILRGLCIDCKDGDANFIGLDGYSVAWDKVPNSGTAKLVIPRESIEALLKLDLIGDVQIMQNKLHSTFRCGDYIVETRLIEGNYPEYRNFFREDGSGKEVTISRDVLLKAIKRASLCGEVKTALVLSFEGPTLTVRMNSTKSKYQECLLLEKEAEGAFEIAFNPAYLEANLRAFNSDSIVMKIGDASRFMILRDGSAFKTMTLPVHLNNGSK